MKEDYLWDRTGKDSDIEKLENALKAFRQQDMTPPELPAKTFVFDNNSLENKKPRRLFQFAFVAFTCLALLIISLGVFQISRIGNQDLAKNDSKETSNEVTKESSIIVQEKSVDENVFKTEKLIEPTITKAEFTPNPKIKRQFIKTRKEIKPKAIYQKAVAKKIDPIKQNPNNKTVKLTEEEQYAYDQLMMALAITNSKLKIVKDKVQGLGETPVSKGTR